MKPNHYLGKAPAGMIETLRLTQGGRWVKDDGVTAGRAFSGMSSGFYPIAVGPDCRCNRSDRRCPMNQARDKTFQRYGVSNGVVMPELRKRKAGR